MADEADNEEKTEDPTPQRLDRMRDEGQLPVGKEISAAASVGAAALVLLTMGRSLGEGLSGLVRISVAGIADPSTGMRSFLDAAAEPTGIVFIVLFAAALGGAIVVAAQTGFLFNLDLVSFKPERLFQLSRLTHFFSREALVDLLLAVVKTVTVASAMAVAMKGAYLSVMGAGKRPAEDLLSAFLAPIGEGLPFVIVALLATGGIDVFVQRYRFMERARMTKDEVKREMKDTEGDPQHRSRRRRRHRELLKGRVNEEVPKADVVVVNPTHIAVALRYQRGKDKAPKVLAKGRGLKADKIRELAREHAVPIYKDIPLARLLHQRVKVGAEVPAETYKAVAAVLAFAYRLKRRSGPRPPQAPPGARR